MGRLNVTLCGIELDNPVIPASGTFGFGYEFAELYDINMLGTFSFKGTTKDPRFGNPTPRIAECYAGMINAVGLQNPGVERVLAEELPKLKQVFHKKVMANVSGFSVEDYAYTCQKLDPCEEIGWLEVNVSCPNVHGGGMAFGTTPEGASAVVLGLNYIQTMVYIIIPQAFKTVLPSLANEFITLLKETSVAFYIGVADLTQAGIRIRSITFSNFMPLIAIALVYLVLVLILTKLVGMLEKKLKQSER